ncbi:hypothetical protein D3C85_1410690 [compost metagenome]
MRLVDREQPDAGAFEQVEEARRHQPFGRHIEDFQPPREQIALHGGGLAAGQCGVEHRCAHTGLGQRSHLVLHQRDQRRDDDTDTLPRLLAQQRRNLVAERLPAARGHEHQAIAALGHMVDDLCLPAAKGVVAEDFFEDRQCARHGQRNSGKP